MKYLLSSAVIGCADDNPSALKLPFVADLVRENLGAALAQPASDDATEVPSTIDDPVILDEMTEALKTLGYPKAKKG